jgi:uncharacterized membrane-anchored protein YhcB (DUF1043 family)
MNIYIYIYRVICLITQIVIGFVALTLLTQQMISQILGFFGIIIGPLIGALVGVLLGFEKNNCRRIELDKKKKEFLKSCWFMKWISQLIF